MNTELILPFAVDLLLKSSAILVLTWLTLQIWRRASAAQRGCVWCVALALTALLPFTRLVAPHWALSFVNASASVKPTPTAGLGESIALVPDEIVSAAPVRTWAMPDELMLGVGIWLAGTFLLVVYRSAGAFLLYRCRHSSFSIDDDAGIILAADIEKDFGITRPVDVRVSHTCRVPVTWGTWRPVVMLPAEALNWPKEWLESALRHEMGHVKNYDHLKRLGAFLTCAFYWPNPLVWLAAKQLQLTQEEASDNLVLRVGVSPQDYATQLIELIRLTAGRSLLSLPGVAMARLSMLEGRLAAILDDTRNRGSADRRLILAGTGLAAVLGLTLGAVQLRAADAFSQKAGVTQTAEAPSKRIIDAADVTLNPKLESIVLSLHFDKATIEEATNFLAIEIKRLDPDHQGFRFIIQPQASKSAQPVTLTLNNISCGEALRYVCKLANVKFKVEDGVVAIIASTQDTRVLTDSEPTDQPASESGQATASKLKSIIIPNVTFSKLDVATVLQFLAQKSRALDPDKKGINFVLGKITPQDHIHREVSVTLDNVPLDELLGYITSQTNLKWSVENNAVYFHP